MHNLYIYSTYYKWVYCINIVCLIYSIYIETQDTRTYWWDNCDKAFLIFHQGAACLTGRRPWCWAGDHGGVAGRSGDLARDDGAPTNIVFFFGGGARFGEKDRMKWWKNCWSSLNWMQLMFIDFFFGAWLLQYLVIKWIDVAGMYVKILNFCRQKQCVLSVCQWSFQVFEDIYIWLFSRMFEDMSSFFQFNLFESDLQSFSVVFPNLTKFSWFCKTSQCEFLLTTLLPKPFHINHLDSKTSYPCWTKKTSSWHFFSIFTTSLRYQILPLIRFFFVFFFLGRFHHLEPSFFLERRCCGPWPVWAGRPRPRRRSWRPWRGESCEES